MLYIYERFIRQMFNPLDPKGNYRATSNNTKLVHWPFMGGVLHLVQREGHGRAVAPPSPLLAVPNVTAHPSTASVPITVLLYDGPLLCGFNVGIKELSPRSQMRVHYAMAMSVCSFVCRL